MNLSRGGNTFRENWLILKCTKTYPLKIDLMLSTIDFALAQVMPTQVCLLVSCIFVPTAGVPAALLEALCWMKRWLVSSAALFLLEGLVSLKCKAGFVVFWSHLYLCTLNYLFGMFSRLSVMFCVCSALFCVFGGGYIVNYRLNVDWWFEWSTAGWSVTGSSRFIEACQSLLHITNWLDP